MSSTNHQTRILNARERTLAWLETLLVPGTAPAVSRYSAQHDPQLWPGLLLPGTYNAVLLRLLLGDTVHDSVGTTNWFETHRTASGVFQIPGMHNDDVWKKDDRSETWNYINFHVTNYSVGALCELDAGYAPILEFVEPWLNSSTLLQWLSTRDWYDPWMEGNNIVNLGSFLALLAASGNTAAWQALHQVCDQLEQWQHPGTGFWGSEQDAGGIPLLHAFAGAMHSYHLWYLLGRALPAQREAMDYVLHLGTEDMGACIDVDAVDLLYHGVQLTGHRREDVECWMQQKLDTLLDLQRDDGGFPDAQTGLLRFDGWVGGYSERQGSSNTFATWFRWIAIAMIADTLWPGWQRWHFRKTLGIGYAWSPPNG